MAKRKKQYRHMDRETKQAMAHVAYLPDEESLDLDKSQKLRTTALLMAINYVDNVICKDAEMYRALRHDGKELVPATTPHVIRTAVQFEAFLLGKYGGELPAHIRLGTEGKEEDERAEPASELPGGRGTDRA